MTTRSNRFLSAVTRFSTWFSSCEGRSLLVDGQAHHLSYPRVLPSWPRWTHLCKTPKQHLRGRAGPVKEYLRHQCDGHFQDSQQADREVKAGGTDLELPAVHKVSLQAFSRLLNLSHQQKGRKQSEALNTAGPWPLPLPQHSIAHLLDHADELGEGPVELVKDTVEEAGCYIRPLSQQVRHVLLQQGGRAGFWGQMRATLPVTPSGNPACHMLEHCYKNQMVLSKNIQIMKVDEQQRTTWELGTSMSASH